jgi:hypothetical protein
VLLSAHGVVLGEGTIDAARAFDGANVGFEDELRAGTFMGRITASGLWTPCKRTTVTPAGGGTNVTAVPVVNARAFRTGDVITVGSSGNVTVSAVNYGTNTLTVSSAITFANSAEVAANDGSQICRGILNEFVKLRDEDGVARNKLVSHLILAGLVDHTLVIGDLAAIRASATTQIPQILFSDTAGQR